MATVIDPRQKKITVTLDGPLMPGAMPQMTVDVQIDCPEPKAVWLLAILMGQAIIEQARQQLEAMVAEDARRNTYKPIGQMDFTKVD